MALSSTLNTRYRPSSVDVTEKYRPLDAIQVTPVDTVPVQAMIQNRMTSFTNLGVRVNRLTFLCVETIDEIAVKEAGKSPPLAVVSSNRSRWIKQGYENANGILEGIVPAVTNFTSVMDTRALAAGAVPIYLPIRMSAAEAAARNVYVFVASDEYTQYLNALKDTGITVVGWRTDGDERLSGFGASRYAALEFFKYINQQNGATCSRMWLFDDNVSYIRSFAGLAAVEGELGANFGIGFRGGTQAQPNAIFSQMSGVEQPGPVAANLHVQAPILQQAVLWNVAQFNAHAYTFSPYFITSAEDTSLTTFLGLANCQYYSGCEIFKGLAGPDNSVGATLLQGSKRDLLNYCYRLKNAVPFACAAVPNAVTLSDVINAERNGPGSPPMVAATQEESVAQTYSKAVEEILAGALANNVVLPAAVFNPGPLVITSKMTRAYV